MTAKAQDEVIEVLVLGIVDSGSSDDGRAIWEIRAPFDMGQGDEVVGRLVRGIQGDGRYQILSDATRRVTEVSGAYRPLATIRRNEPMLMAVERLADEGRGAINVQVLIVEFEDIGVAIGMRAVIVAPFDMSPGQPEIVGRTINSIDGCEWRVVSVDPKWRDRAIARGDQIDVVLDITE
jgi:hypothetical protein